MKAFILIVILFSFFSCQTTNETIEIQNQTEIDTEEKSVGLKDSIKLSNIDYNVKITITRYFPYCGGAAPTEDMLNRNSPYNQYVYLIDLSDSTKLKIKPNNDGIHFLKLKKGDYAIQELYKDVSYEEFYKNNSTTGMYIQAVDSNQECYKRWWKSYLVQFSVTDEQNILELFGNISSRCFIGKDPCVNYTGPMPP